MNKEGKNQDAEFHEAVSAESQEEAIPADILNDNAVTNSEKKHLIINKETGKVIDAKTGEELTDIQVVTKTERWAVSPPAAESSCAVPMPMRKNTISIRCFRKYRKAFKKNCTSSVSCSHRKRAGSSQSSSRMTER